jgi:hypothetical protein
MNHNEMVTSVELYVLFYADIQSFDWICFDYDSSTVGAAPVTIFVVLISVHLGI